jgi:hypothetical protein
VAADAEVDPSMDRRLGRVAGLANLAHRETRPLKDSER